jgi:hypothetical protein
MQVKHGLRGRRALAGDQVEVAAQACGQLGGPRHGGGGDDGVLGEVGDVYARDDQDVSVGASAFPGGVGTGEKRNGVRPFGDDVGRAVAGGDVAEGAGGGAVHGSSSPDGKPLQHRLPVSCPGWKRETPAS